MRKLMLWGALASMSALIPSCGHAQGQGSGILYASDFAAWSLPQGTAPAAGMIQWPSAAICQVSSNGFTFTAVKVGRPLTVVDVVPSQSETVIPTAVTTSGGSCTVTAPMAHLHTSYSVRSGTAGLQEAIDYSAKIVGGSVVILTPGWTVAGGVSGMITSAYGQSATSILDERVATLCQYAWNGSAYVATGCSTDAASLSALTLQTFAGPLAVPQGITAPITGHASLDLPLTGGTLTGALVGPQINGTFTPATSANLASIISGAGAGSDILLQCGTYTVASGISIPSPGVHLHGTSRDCAFVNFTSVAGIAVSGANVEVNGITFEGQTGSYSVQAASTATGFRFHDNAVTQAGQGASTFPQAALWIQTGASDSFVENNLFYGNGPTIGQPAGYTILTDGQTAGYVNRLHLIHNKIYSNNNGISMALFDCNACVIQNADIDQGNADFTAAEGTGYGLMLYSMGYNTGTTSLARASNTVTMVVPTMPATWPPTVGETMMVTGYGFGTSGTSFNGTVTLLTVSGTGTGPYTMTWAQTAPDDTVTGGALSPGTIQPPVQHAVIGNPHITNTAGACIYLQGVSNISISGGELSQCDLSIVPVSLPHSGIGVNGLIGGTISGVHVDTVGHSSAFSLNHTYGLAFGSNSGKNANKNCVTLFDNYNLSATGNTCRNNTGGGFIGQSTTAINSYKSSFTGNDIWMTGAGSGYAFQGVDQFDKVTGGSVHAPASGTAVAGVFALASTSNISATGVAVDCTADGGTVATMSYGLRTAGTDTHFEGNSVKGCGAAGIFDAGTNTTAQDNKVSASVIGILSTGTTPNILFNTLTGNTTALTNSGATNPVVLGNVLIAGTLPTLRTSNLTFADGTSLTTASLAAQNWVYGANANTVETFNLNAAAGVQRLFGVQSAGLPRWSWGADTGTESGANAGSPFVIRAYDDAGTTIDVPVTIVRAAGGTETHTRPVVMPSLKVTGAAGASTFCLQIDNIGNVSNTGTGCGAAGAGVASINGTAGTFTFAGAGVSCTSTTCTFSGTGSGVTSVALTTPSWLTVSGSPITTSGTLAVTGTSEAANLFLASPNGSSGAMTPRAIVAADVPLLTSTQIPAQYKIKPCTVGMGDGLNAIPAGTYPIKFQCFNDYGVTYTITGFQCASDNAGTSAGNAADNSANALLTSAITATPTWASGTQSATTTLANGTWVNWTIVADGTSKQITCRMKGTY